MKMNKKGFTLIELLAVIVILAVIALIASPIILGIINDAQESSRIRSVEAYMNAINTTVTTYMTLNPNESVNTICSSACNATCQIDATKEARNSGKVSTGCTKAGKAVTYSGSAVSCEKVEYDNVSGTLSVKKCKVGNDKNTYSGSNKDGIKNDTPTA